VTSSSSSSQSSSTTLQSVTSSTMSSSTWLLPSNSSSTTLLSETSSSSSSSTYVSISSESSSTKVSYTSSSSQSLSSTSSKSSSAWLSSSSSKSSSTALDVTSSSTSQSGNQGWIHLPARFTCQLDRSVLCFARNAESAFAGNGAGEILYYPNQTEWRVQESLVDKRINCLAFWQDDLFVGTGPFGQIYRKTDGTGAAAVSATINDQSVTAFAEYKEELYAGTAPAGRVYRFNGARWIPEFDAYGGGVTAMTVYNNQLYVFLAASETGAVFDGTGWSAFAVTVPPPPEDLTLSSTSPWLNAEGQSYNLASHRTVTKDVLSEEGQFIDRIKVGNARRAEANGELGSIDRMAIRPPGPDCFVGGAGGGTSLYLGTGTGKLLAYDGSLSTLYQTDSGGVSGICVLTDDVIAFATGGKLMLWEENAKPILDLRSTHITTLFPDSISNALLVGLEDGRILRLEHQNLNAYLTGERSLYASILNCLGEESENWQSILYQMGQHILRIDDDKEEIATHEAAALAGHSRQKVTATFTSDPMEANADFGWWQSAVWETNAPIGTKVDLGIRFAQDLDTLKNTEWHWYSSSSGVNTADLGRYSGHYVQVRMRLISTVADLSPSVTTLQISYRSRYSSYFFTKKFVMEGNSINAGLVTARTVTPRFADVVVGISGTNSADWSGYTVVPLDRAFQVPPTMSKRFKLGIKLVQYKPSAAPQVIGFGLMFGGNSKTKMNE
jgi:hypothetical protein